MAEKSPFRKSVQTTLDASGNGSVQIGPAYYNQTWEVKSYAVEQQTSAADPDEPECRYYAADVLLDATYTGSLNGGSFETTLLPNQVCRAEWTGGEPGATAILTIQGIQVVGN